jgi:hypothetical protein
LAELPLFEPMNPPIAYAHPKSRWPGVTQRGLQSGLAFRAMTPM